MASFSVLLLCLSTIAKVIAQSTCGGNGNNASCVFPFEYGDIQFDQCTTYGRGASWCSTTADYDTDKSWGFCDCTNITPAPTYVTTEPRHYTYTRGSLNNGVLEAVVIRMLYAGDADISDFEWANYSAPSIALYYTDSSWGKLTYSFTIIPTNLQSSLNGDTASNGQTALEGFRLAEKEGYIWCNGICGTEGKIKRDTNHFDQIVVAVRDHQSTGNSAHEGWAGLGTVGHPKTWVKSNSFGYSVTQHEFGHNLGLPHQYNTKLDRIENDIIDIGSTTDGESRMGGGGHVNTRSESSRYKSNGHFGPCAKDWFGWLEPENIVTLSRDGVSSGMFTLNAYDRPDVIPNNTDTISATGSNVFLLKVEYGSQYEYWENNGDLDILYIYYRTSYAGADSGASVQFCKLNTNGQASGAYMNTYTYDAKGYTYTQRDHYVDVGQSFVIQPTIHSLEGLNPLLAKMNLVNLTVLSVSDGWQDCSKDTYICNVTHPNLSLTVKVAFISDYDNIVMANNSNKDPFSVTDSELHCTSSNVQPLQIDTNVKHYHVIHVQAEDEIGIYGRGLAKINFCASRANLQTYVFDEYPYNILNNYMNNDLGIGSLFSYPFNGDFDSYSCTYPNCKIETVQIVQNDAEHLHIAELQIFEEINGTNIANQAECVSFPEGGHYYNNPDHLTDGDINTYSHSGSSGKYIYDACTFEGGVAIEQVKVWPRDSNWQRSSNLTVKLWRKQLYGSTQNHNEMLPSGLLFSFDINETDSAWEGDHENLIIPHVLHDLEPESCNSSQFMDIPFIAGEFWLVVEVADDATDDGIVNIEMNMAACSVTQCPINTYGNGNRSDGGLMCERCPTNYYANVGITSIDDCKQCPLHRELINSDLSWCTIEECQTVTISHNNGLGNALDGIYHLFGRHSDSAIYLSQTLNYMISYNINNNKYEIIDLLSPNSEVISDTTELINDNSEHIYPFLVDGDSWFERGVLHYDNTPNTKVQMVVIIQRNNHTSDTYNVLNIAELEIFPKYDPTLNIAPTHATCFNFPINQGWYWYDGDKYGFVTDLTDENIQTATQNGADDGDPYWFCSSQPCLNMCYLNESIEIDRIIVYPPQNSWRWSRTSDIKIDIYESVTFSVNNYTETSVNNTMMDNAILGNLIYSKDHIALSENKTIMIEKIITPENMPINVKCPYKYALGYCQDLLNANCDYRFPDSDYIARFAETDTTSNDDLRWMCMNKTYLTTDTLNYKMVYPQPSLLYQSGWQWSLAGTQSNLVDQCLHDFIVKYVDYTCTVNTIETNALDSYSFMGGDDIVCSLTTKNLNSESIIFDDLQWSISIIGKEKSNCYFPIKSSTTIDTENHMISTSFTVPICRAIWDISFVIDQTPIGGNEFVLWTNGNVPIAVDNFDEIMDGKCVEFDGNKLLDFIDANTFNPKFSGFTDISMEMLLNGPNAWCYQTKEPSLYPTDEPSVSPTKEQSIGTQQTFDEDNQENKTENAAFVSSAGFGVLMAVIVLLCILIFVGIFFVMKRKRNAKGTKSGVEMQHSTVDNNDGTHINIPQIKNTSVEGGAEVETVTTPLSASSAKASASNVQRVAMIDEESDGDENETDNRECGECGEIASGKIDENDGVFYCNSCWANLE